MLAHLESMYTNIEMQIIIGKKYFICQQLVTYIEYWQNNKIKFGEKFIETTCES